MGRYEVREQACGRLPLSGVCDVDERLAPVVRAVGVWFRRARAGSCVVDWR